MVTGASGQIRSAIRNVPDFPKKGIVFRDITTLLKDRNAFKQSIEIFTERYKSGRIDKVVGVESRGFIFGSVVAYRLGAGFIPARKPGKLPGETLREEYQLEYGTDALEIHRDALAPGDRVLIIDDLLATGGTASAACALVRKLGARIVGVAFLIELSFLRGREKLKDVEVFSVVTYDME